MIGVLAGVPAQAENGVWTLLAFLADPEAVKARLALLREATDEAEKAAVAYVARENGLKAQAVEVATTKERAEQNLAWSERAVLAAKAKRDEVAARVTLLDERELAANARDTALIKREAQVSDREKRVEADTNKARTTVDALNKRAEALTHREAALKAILEEKSNA